MSTVFSYISLHIRTFWRHFSAVTALGFAILSGLLLFFDLPSCITVSRLHRVLALLAVLLACTLIAVLITCFYRSKTIFRSGNHCLTARYGDLWKIAFPKKEVPLAAQKAGLPAERIVVVGVNTTFDTIVEAPSPNIKNPLVSPGTLHGQWVNQILSCGVAREELDAAIAKNLKLQDVAPKKTLTTAERPRGNRACYEEGAIAEYQCGKTLFYLLALSEFDENNNAQSTKSRLFATVEALIDHYDKCGQGMDIYIPLLGTGMSRIGITQSESLALLTMIFRLYQEKVHGHANIVVYHKERKSISIDI